MAHQAATTEALLLPLALLPPLLLQPPTPPALLLLLLPPGEFEPMDATVGVEAEAVTESCSELVSVTGNSTQQYNTSHDREYAKKQNQRRRLFLNKSNPFEKWNAHPLSFLSLRFWTHRKQ